MEKLYVRFREGPSESRASNSAELLACGAELGSELKILALTCQVSLETATKCICDQRKRKKRGKNNHKELTGLNLFTGFSSQLQSLPMGLLPKDVRFFG